MVISKREKDAVWNNVFVREGDYYNSLAELSLLNKDIRNPSFLQLRIETLFLAHKHPKSSIFLTKFSEQELSCLLLAAWGFEIGETAEILGLKEDSINKCRANISKKLGTRNIPNSVFIATQAGILTFDNVDFILQPKNKTTQY